MRPGFLRKAAVALVAVIVIATAVFRLESAQRGVTVSQHRVGAIPVTAFQPAGPERETRRPVVVIAHGFAGSQQLMLPYALTLARNGYIAVTFDFPGHGRNGLPMAGGLADFEATTGVLLEALGQVTQAARQWPGGDGRIALLGHSMASDVVIREAMRNTAAQATVALSAYSPVATATQPRNLLIVDGEFEPAMLHAEGLRITGLGLAPGTQAVAGRTYGRIEDGTARRFVLADGVEHLSVLYSREALQEALDWIDRSFGRAAAPGEARFIDARGAALGLLYLGLVALAWPLAALLPRAVVAPVAAPPPLPWRRLWPIAVAPAVLTPLLLWKVPGGFLPILLGDYLLLHFALYGLLTAAGLWLAGARRAPLSGVRRPALALAALAAGAYGLAAIGLPLDRYVTSFAPDAQRGALVLAVCCGALPYFLADEWLVRGASAARGAYACTKLMFLLSLALAIALNPGRLFFLAIVVPAILIAFAIYGLFSRWVFERTGHPWAGACANALAFSWLVAVSFPVVAR